MRCPHCNQEGRGANLGVVDSRNYSFGIRRKRKCGDCGARFNTIERLEEFVPRFIVHPDGKREKFNPGNLEKSIREACRGRMRGTEVRNIIKRVGMETSALGLQAIPSAKITEIIVSRLAESDWIAAFRYEICHSGDPEAVSNKWLDRGAVEGKIVPSQLPLEGFFPPDKERR